MGLSPGSCSVGGCSSARADHAPAVVALQALVQPPDGRAAVDLPDGRRVFAPAGAYPDTVRTQVDRVASVKPV